MGEQVPVFFRLLTFMAYGKSSCGQHSALSQHSMPMPVVNRTPHGDAEDAPTWLAFCKFIAINGGRRAQRTEPEFGAR